MLSSSYWKNDYRQIPISNCHIWVVIEGHLSLDTAPTNQRQEFVNDNFSPII
jgi:hypothetical protein